MHLSKLILNPAVTQVRREIANPYELHRTLCRCVNGEDAGRLLWRLEPGGRNPPALLVQTSTDPTWSAVTARVPDYFAEPPTTKPYDPRPAEHAILRFRLRANPSVKRESKRRGLNTYNDQILWLRRKGEQGGFDVLSVFIQDECFVSARKPGHDIRLAAVTYDGILAVTDMKRFHFALEHGIGPAKGLGFGLLSIGSART